MRRLCVLVLAVLLLTPHRTRSQGSTYPVFASDLQRPTKVVLLPNGLVLAAEAGSGNNDGRISLFNNAGERHTLIEGLPSAPESVPDSVSGPNSLAIRGQTMYISIGIGDVLRPGGWLLGQFAQVGLGKLNPNPPSSPIFSSVLQINFDSDMSFDLSKFSLTRAHHDQLALGSTVVLANADGKRAEVKVLVKFLPGCVADPSVAKDCYRCPDPFDLVLDSTQSNVLYVTDGGLSKVVKVDTNNGERQDFVKFEKVKNTNALLGSRWIDPVPTGARQQGNWLYVAFLTGFPYPRGAAEIHRIDLVSGTDQALKKGLTSTEDVEPVGDNTLYVLQLSTNLTALLGPAPGRLLRFDLNALDKEPVVVADQLNLPNSMARDPATGAIFVVQIGAGNIIRVSPQ